MVLLGTVIANHKVCALECTGKGNVMEIFESYLRQIQRYPLLDAQQEVELSKEIEKGSKVAQTKLINSNLRLVVSIAKRFAGTPRVSMMDLIQEGNMGLMMAAAKFHYGFNTRFSTYAYSWILQYMLRYIYNKTSMISLPHRKEELLRRITAARNDYKQNLNHEPTKKELAEYCGTTIEDIESVLAFACTVTSMDIETSEESGTTVGDLIPDTSYNPEETFIRRQDILEIKEMVDTLPDKERRVIYYRFNFDYDSHVPTLRELSAALGVSAETVRQMEMRAVKKIKQAAVTMQHRQLVTA